MDNKFGKSTEPFITRTFQTPNGQTQVVAMPKNGWECLDWMISEMGENLEQIVQICWNFVEEYPEECFMTAFNYYVHKFMIDYQSKRDGLTNDNNGYADPNWPHATHSQQQNSQK